MRVRYLLAILGSATVLALACVLPRYEADRNEPLKVEDGGAPEAAADGTLPPEAGADRDPRWCDPCKDLALLRAPCRPELADPDGPAGTRVFAARTVRYGVRLDDPGIQWRTIGMDLDCLATGKDGTPTQCMQVKDAATGLLTPATEDGEQGRDNSFGSNFGNLLRAAHGFGSTQPDEEVAANERWEHGLGGLLVQVKGLGEGPEDPHVEFAVLSTGGTVAEDGGYAQPGWDGGDTWSVSSASLNDGKPVWIDDNAFLTGNVLVARPATVPLQFGPGSLALNIWHPTLLLQLNAEHTQIVEGTMAGTWLTTDAIAMMDALLRQGCVDSATRMTATNFLKASSDVRHDLSPEPTLGCNAVSFAFAFTAHLANLGPVITVEPAPPADAGCDPESTD